MDLGYNTHVGMVREQNEDSLLVLEKLLPEFNVFAVADGMGGHNAGEVASKMAIREIEDFFKDHQRDRDFIISREYIGQLINHINMKIYERANSEPHLKGMGTTLTLIIHFKRTIHIAHIGDSRAYRINNQEIQQLTEDHSLVAGLIKEGKITKEEAQVHPQKNVITRALGTDIEIQADVYRYKISDGETIMICSDGLTNSLTEAEIKNIVNRNDSLQKAADDLVQQANISGGRDNITVILFQC